MTSGDEGVSDFGISPVGTPALHAGPHRDDPRFALASAVRRLISATVAARLSDEQVTEASAAVDELAGRIEARSSGRRQRSQPDPTGHPQDFFPTSPVIGFANPVAPPVSVEAVDGELRGKAFFDHQYEGPPSCVHGGVIALVFDELLGAANILAGAPGMTGTLTVRYRRPTPLRTELRLAARLVSRSGRKIRTWGGIYHRDVLLAEADGVFIELAPERFLRIVAGAAESAGRPGDGTRSGGRTG